MISRAAIDAVTNPDNMTPRVDGEQGITAVDERSVVEELRRLDDALSADDAQRLGRDAVAHVGGQVRIIRSRHIWARRPGAKVGQDQEAWWVPTRSIQGHRP